jgi:hypothetical protein
MTPPGGYYGAIPAHSQPRSPFTKNDEAENTQATNGTFLTLRINICRDDGVIKVQSLAEDDCITTLDGPLFDPQCRVCRAKSWPGTSIGRKIASHLHGHTKTCLDLEVNYSCTVRHMVAVELNALGRGICEKSNTFYNMGKRIECM